MRNLSTEYKIEVFETLALSRLVYLALLTVIPNHINEEVAKIQFFYDSYPRIKQEWTLRQGAKNVDIRFKFVSLHCSWVKKMMIVFMNGREFLYIYLVNILALLLIAF